MKKNILFFSFLVILFSCNRVPSMKMKVLGKTYKEISFDIGYNIARINVGVFQEHDKYFFYFFNHVYTDTIQIFDKKGEKVGYVNISKYNVPHSEIVEVFFLNEDTIFLRSKQEVIYLIHKNSNLIKAIDLRNKNLFGLDSLYDINWVGMLNDTTALFFTIYSNVNNPYRENNYCKHLKYYVKNAFHSKRLMFVQNLYADSFTVQHRLRDFEYSRPLHQSHIKTQKKAKKSIINHLIFK